MKTHACTRATPCVNEVKPEVFTQKAKLLFCNPTFYWESTNHVKMEGKQREVFTFYYTAPDILPDGVCFYFPRDFSGTFSCYFPIYRCTVSQYNQETGFKLKNKQLPPKSSLHCIALNLILLHAFASLALARKTPIYFIIWSFSNLKLTKNVTPMIYPFPACTFSKYQIVKKIRWIKSLRFFLTQNNILPFNSFPASDFDAFASLLIPISAPLVHIRRWREAKHFISRSRWVGCQIHQVTQVHYVIYPNPLFPKV